jgi:hypothetical protein
VDGDRQSGSRGGRVTDPARGGDRIRPKPERIRVEAQDQL